MRTTIEPPRSGRPRSAAPGGGTAPRRRPRRDATVAPADADAAAVDRLIVLCRYLPDRSKSSGELRFWQILRHLRRRSRTLTVFAETPGNRHLFPELTVHPMSALRDKARGADLAFLEFWFMGRYIAALRRQRIPVIVDSVDVEFLRREREKAILGASGDYTRRERAREIAAYRAADQVWTVSEADAARIRGLSPSIVVVPNIFTAPRSVPRFATRAGVSFVGSYCHQPNVDGLRWYRDRIWPRLRDLPHAILGHGAPEDIRAMPGFVGGVEASAAHVARARVSIAPLRYGAGLKGKVLEAMACGTPVVTTSIGDEGYAASSQGVAIVADDPEAFADAVRRLATDKAAWNRMSQRGRAFAARYAPSAVGPIIDGALGAALAAGATRA